VHTLRALELLVEIHRRRGENERAADYQALLDSERGR